MIEAINPYEILPSPVWNAIIENVKSPFRKLTILLAYPQLEVEFQERKQEWLFYAAIPVVFHTLKSDSKPKDDDLEGKALRNAFFTCRLVSTGSCRAIDKYLVNHLRKFNGIPPIFYVGEGMALGYGHIFNGGGKIMEEMAAHPGERSSVLSRHLNLGLWLRQGLLDPPERELFAARVLDVMRRGINPEDDPELAAFREQLALKKPFEEQVLGFLEKGGKHLLGLNFLLRVNLPINNSVIWVSSKVEEILHKTPNLETLTLTANSSAGGLLNVVFFSERFPRLQRLSLDGFTLINTIESEKTTKIFPHVRLVILKNFPLATKQQKKRFFSMLKFLLVTAKKLKGFSIQPLSLAEGRDMNSKDMKKFVRILKSIIDTLPDNKHWEVDPKYENDRFIVFLMKMPFPITKELAEKEGVEDNDQNKGVFADICDKMSRCNIS